VNTTPDPDALTRHLRRTAQFLAAFIASIGVAVVVAWKAGAGEWLVLGPSQVPMAPGTGLLCILLGFALMGGTDGARSTGPTPRSQALAAAALLLALGFFSSQYVGYDLSFERWLSGTSELRNGFRVGRTSPVTSLLFGMLAVAILLRGGRLPRNVQSILISLALALAIVILQGYILGAPLMYDAEMIPVAVPTAILVALSSVAALLHLGPESWPLRLFVRSQRLGVLPSKSAFVWFALLLSAIITSSGVFWYRNEVHRNEERVSSSLRVVVHLKTRELATWHQEQRVTAEAVGLTLQPAAEVLQAALARDVATGWLQNVKSIGKYEHVALYDAAGRRVVTLGDADESALAELDARARLLPAVDTALEQDGAGMGSALRLVFWVALPRRPEVDPVPGAWLALVLNAEDALMPRLGERPTAFRSGEFVLWRRDGDSLRLSTAQGFAAVTNRRPALSLADSIAAPAIAFREGRGDYEANDYRGVMVRASVLVVPGTPWMLVGKVDHHEIEQPVIRAAIRVTFVTLLFLLGAAAIIYALWYRRDLMRATRELELMADRERGIAELQRNESRYARAMRGTSDGLWDWDLSSGEVFVSPRWREIVGVSDGDEIHSKDDLLSYFDAASVVEHEAVLARHLEHREPYDLEMELLSRPGEGARWVRSRGEAERDADGRALRMGGAITDITRRRLTEASLHRSQRVLRMRSAVNQALVRAEIEDELFQAICDIGVRDGGYRMAWIGLKLQDEAQSVTPVAVAGEEHGYLREIAVSWGDNELGRGPSGRCLRTGEVQVAQNILAEYNYAPWREAARARGYQSSASIPLKVGDEVVGCFMLYSEDPDAFDAAEVSLARELGHDISFGIAVLRDHRVLDEQREQLTLFRQAIDRSADAVFVADLDTGLFVDFNLAAVEQLGYSDAELRRLGPADVVVELGAHGGLASVAAKVRAAGGVVRPSINRRKDGSEVPVEVALTVMDIGQRTLILGISRDISDRVKSLNEREELQAQLTRAQKMESVGRLAGGVAHDFNNLLTVITTSADLALSELAADHVVRHDILEIRNAGERAARLTRQLLAFSRQQVLKREVLNLNDLVTKFLGMLSRVIGEDVQVELKLGAKVSPIFADSGQLEQVLMNLCVNARDAMPNGGTLTISTGEANVDENHVARREGMSPGEYATLSISDTGFGMDKQTQAKIFEPFFTTKEQGRGTGLGLSTVYGIVKQSGGSIWCYSEVGIGTTFRIYLPITDADIEEHVSVLTKGPEVGKETVLVVEDEDSIRFVARRVLERSGYSVLEAESGTAALALLAAHTGPLDLVVSDLVMPGMTGIELAEELKKTRPTLRVLFTSGYSADVVSDRFHPDGDWNFISKPYGVRELVQEVRRVLDS
jgi:PAS domain S-box-containing protein